MDNGEGWIWINVAADIIPYKEVVAYSLIAFVNLKEFYVVVCIVLSTATYAYVTYEGEDVVIKEEPTLELLHVEYTDTSNISMFNSRAGDEFEKTFNITNVSGKEMYGTRIVQGADF